MKNVNLILSNRGKLILLSTIIYNYEIFYRGSWIHRNFNQFIFFYFLTLCDSSLINGLCKN